MKVLISGDFCPHNRVTKLVEKLDKEAVFNDFIQVIEDSDFAITNLECPVNAGNLFSIEKVGPVLSTNLNSVKLLKEVGFDMVTLANNHIKDLGDEGVEATLEALQNEKLLFVGAGKGIKEASKTEYVTIENKVLGIINITENEFSTTNNEYEYGAHPLDIIENWNSLKAAKNNADYAVIIYHGGHEGFQLPSPRMKKLFHFFVDNGADAVICHHAHCFSGFEVYCDRPIFYGLGNFVFDWEGLRNVAWNRGYAVEINFNSHVSFKLIPYIQGEDLEGVRLMNEIEKESFYKEIQGYNNIILDDDLLLREFNRLMCQRRKEYEALLQPYSGRILKGLYKRGLIPSLLSKKKNRVLLNLIRCESHYDLIKAILEKKISK